MADAKVSDPVQPCMNKQELPPEQDKNKTHFIKFQVNDENGKGFPGIIVSVALPDNSIHEEESDGNGVAEIKNIDSGTITLESDWRDFTLDEVVLIQ